jgi:hypothetical protein
MNAKIVQLVRDGWRRRAVNHEERLVNGKVVGRVTRMPDGSWRWVADLGRVQVGDFECDADMAREAVERTLVGRGW